MYLFTLSLMVCELNQSSKKNTKKKANHNKEESSQNQKENQI